MNEHKMITRSKKSYGINIIDISGNNDNGPDIESEEEQDIDEHGNVTDLIDYEYDKHLSPKSKKNIEHIQFYEKLETADLKIKYVEAYRAGWVTVLGDEMPYYDFDADEYDPEIGVDVWSLPTEDHEFLDGVSDDITFPETLSL